MLHVNGGTRAPRCRALLDDAQLRLAARDPGTCWHAGFARVCAQIHTRRDPRPAAREVRSPHEFVSGAITRNERARRANRALIVRATTC